MVFTRSIRRLSFFDGLIRFTRLRKTDSLLTNQQTEGVIFMDMQSTGKFMKGMATGLVVGAAVTMVTDPLSERQRRKLHKKTEGVFKSVGGIIDTAVDMMK